MRAPLITLGIGLASGVLSGAFGIGGGIITTPAIRLILGAPALIAVGTPLPVIFPSAVTGAISYSRSRLVDLRAGIACGVAGSLAAVLGAWTTRLVGGNVVLITTAVLILYTAADMVLQVIRPPRVGLEAAEERDAFVGPRESTPAALRSGRHSLRSGPPERSDGSPATPDEGHVFRSEGPRMSRPDALWKLGLLGAVAGFYSGFLGLGGGFVLVPMLTRWMGFPIKRAIATSLLTIAILAVPGTAMHAWLGHVDWGIALWLALGVIPGAWLGSRLTLGAADRTVRLGFAGLLLVTGLWLGIATLTGGGA
jgi:uncharacterized protein